MADVRPAPGRRKADLQLGCGAPPPRFVNLPFSEERERKNTTPSVPRVRFPWGSFSSPCVCHCVFVYLDSFFVSFHHHPLPQTVLLVSDSRRRLLSRHPTPAYLVQMVGAVATSMPATRFGDSFLARSGDWRCRTLHGKGTRKLSRERVRKNVPAFFTERLP